MICTNCSDPISPIIAVDIDGTLGDYHHAFTTFCCRYFNLPRPNGWWDGEGEFEDYIGITKQQYRDAKLAYRQGGNKRWAVMFPNADHFMAALNNMGLEVWLTTTRPWLRLDNIDPDTREWLRRNHIKYHGLLYDDDKYSRLCTVVDRQRIIGVVDDLSEMLGAALDLGLPTFQIERDHNRHDSVRWMPRGDLRTALSWAIDQHKKWSSA